MGGSGKTELKHVGVCVNTKGNRFGKDVDASQPGISCILFAVFFDL